MYTEWSWKEMVVTMVFGGDCDDFEDANNKGRNRGKDGDGGAGRGWCSMVEVSTPNLLRFEGYQTLRTTVRDPKLESCDANLPGLRKLRDTQDVETFPEKDVNRLLYHNDDSRL
ncbi:hypothetical protein QVD17_17138 [Tagetes erecta]|uniref:Uncharacterized protein n=1 Tax=Tagetes erecta TaxID=13708 RepID=A0AAD8KW55_TARER|nr:hypothetical protein QVD17_17138 [Tagetes erecta]